MPVSIRTVKGFVNKMFEPSSQINARHPQCQRSIESTQWSTHSVHPLFQHAKHCTGFSGLESTALLQAGSKYVLVWRLETCSLQFSWLICGLQVVSHDVDYGRAGMTPGTVVRGMGPWGSSMIRGYIQRR